LHIVTQLPKDEKNSEDRIIVPKNLLALWTDSSIKVLEKTIRREMKRDACDEVVNLLGKQTVRMNSESFLLSIKKYREDQKRGVASITAFLSNDPNRNAIQDLFKRTLSQGSAVFVYFMLFSRMGELNRAAIQDPAIQEEMKKLIEK